MRRRFTPAAAAAAPARLSLRRVQMLWVLWIGQAVCAGFMTGLVVAAIAGRGLWPFLGAGAVGLVMVLRFLEDRVAS